MMWGWGRAKIKHRGQGMLGQFEFYSNYDRKASESFKQLLRRNACLVCDYEVKQMRPFQLLFNSFMLMQHARLSKQPGTSSVVYTHNCYIQGIYFLSKKKSGLLTLENRKLDQNLSIHSTKEEYKDLRGWDQGSCFESLLNQKRYKILPL